MSPGRRADHPPSPGSAEDRARQGGREAEAGGEGKAGEGVQRCQPQPIHCSISKARSCPLPHTPGQGPPPAQGPRAGQPIHLLKDAVVPDFAAGFVPDDQNLQGQKQEAVEDRLGAALTLGGPRLGDRGGSIKAGSCGPLR